MEILYSIDKTPLKIKRVGFIDKKLRHDKVSFELDNLNLYDENGNVLKQAEQKDYDFSFCKRLMELVKNSYGKTNSQIVNGFLERHYAVSHPKENFLEHLEFVLEKVFIPPIFKNTTDVSELVRQWISKQNPNFTRASLRIKDVEDIARFAYHLQSSKFNVVTELKEFLDDQLAKSDDKEGFLTTLKYSVCGHDSLKKSPDRVKFITDWISEKENPENESESFEPIVLENINQKLLLLESLGVLDAISKQIGEQISSRKMGRILADLLNEKETTVTRALRYFNPHSVPQDKNNPRTEKNLEKLHFDLIKLKLPKLAQNIEQELSKIYFVKD